MLEIGDLNELLNSSSTPQNETGDEIGLAGNIVANAPTIIGSIVAILIIAGIVFFVIRK